MDVLLLLEQLQMVYIDYALDVSEKQRARERDIRNASKVLRPSEKPFFSPKAPSSKPWSAKPFIRSCIVHRSINVRSEDVIYPLTTRT